MQFLPDGHITLLLLLLLSHFSRVRLYETPQRAVRQAPQSLGFSRQEHWSGLPFPSSGVLPQPLEPKGSCLTILYTVPIVKAIVFPVVMYECESWTIKKAECRRIDTFKLWCWRRLLRVPWTARRSNQSILKEINPQYSLEGLMLKLKLQYFGH